MLFPGAIGGAKAPTALKENLANAVNDAARKITLRGKQVVVPLKFDEDGNPASPDKLIFKRLSLNDLRYLQALRKRDWNPDMACEDTGISRDCAERLIKKLACFREEDARIKAICEIPTPDWIAAKHVQNVYEGGTLADSEHKSLQELAKIEGAYKNNLNVSVTQNVFNLPRYDPETERKLKEIADNEAQIIQDAQVVHG